MGKKFLTALAAVACCFCAHASIVINEIMPKNVTYQVDDKFQFTGWAELYNSGAQPVDVSLYFFSKDITNPTMWQMKTNKKVKADDLVIQPGKFLVVYFDEEDDALHASFKMEAKRGSLYLADETGTIIDKVQYDTTYRNTAYGRLRDGEEPFVYLNNATPNASNNGSVAMTKQTAQPSFSRKGGFFNDRVSVSITAPDASAKIYYTTDGSEPKATSQVYTQPVEINKNTPLRAIALKEGELPSDVVTETYFVNERNITIPVVSIVTDPDLMYGDQLGLIVAGKNGQDEVPGYCSGPDQYANYWNDWDRPCNFELFDENHKSRINQEVKIGTFGACSRTKYVKSLKVNAGKIYGDKDFDYAIFKEKPNLKWESVVLRNGGNDFGRSYLRDGFMQSLLIGRMDIDHQAYEPSVTFINGKYYGILNIRERTNKHFVFSNYGFRENEFYMNEGGHANEGTDYQDLLDLAESKYTDSKAVYKQLCDMMDMNEFLNYFVAEMYYVNTDWPGGNIKCWKPRAENGRWRWILYDTDFGFSLYGNNYNKNMVSQAKNSPLFKALLNNEEVKRHLLTKFTVHLATTFKTERVIHILDSMLAVIDTEARFYANYLAEKGKIEQNFDTDIENMRNFARKRPEFVFKGLTSSLKLDSTALHISSNIGKCSYYLNDELIDVDDFRSTFFKGIEYELTCEVPNGYKFKQWEITDASGSKSTNDKITLSGMYDGESFRAVLEADPTYNPDAIQLYINEICASNDVYIDEYREADDWIEIYNAGDKAVDLAGMYLSVDADKCLGMYQFPTGSPALTTVPAKGYKIVWADKDDEQGPLHTNFNIPMTREQTIALSELKSVSGTDSTFNVIDKVTYKLHKQNESFARFSYEGDGDWKITGKQTFEGKNIFAYALDVPTVYADEAVAVVYPNPVRDELWFALPWSESVQVSIAQYTGKIIDSFIVKDGEAVSLAHLSRGLYLAIMTTPDGVKVVKFIKE